MIWQLVSYSVTLRRRWLIGSNMCKSVANRRPCRSVGRGDSGALSEEFNPCSVRVQAALCRIVHALGACHRARQRNKQFRADGGSACCWLRVDEAACCVYAYILALLTACHCFECRCIFYCIQHPN